MDLFDHLAKYVKQEMYPMHMPGHKRNTALCTMPNPYAVDTTEVEGTDNLYEAEGVLLRMQQRAAKLWGAAESFVLINGSSGGLLAAIRAATKPGDTVLVARNCHQAVYHALLLGRLRPVYLQPELVRGYSFCGALSAEAVEQGFSAHPEARALILTSPTYEGICSDVAAIAEASHRYGAAVIVDEAHGAHLGFSEKFPPSAVLQGADLVVQSLHKTLPVLTQTSVLHRCSERVSSTKVRRNLRIFGSSSPSYLLMGSADRCFSLLEEQGAALFAAYQARLAAFEEQAKSWKHLHLLTADEVGQFDPGKLVVCCGNTSATGVELARRLREDYRIETELAAEDYLLAMTSVADTDEGFARLAAALAELDDLLTAGEVLPPPVLPTLPEQVLIPADAEQAPHEAVSLAEADGRICGELLRLYPPGIPLYVPGERLQGEKLAALLRQQALGRTVLSAEGAFPERIVVLKD